MSLTAKDLLVKSLGKIGCDGLAGEECGCGIEDLAPCGGDCLGCRPARSRVVRGELVWEAVQFMRPNHAAQLPPGVEVKP